MLAKPFRDEQDDAARYEEKRHDQRLLELRQLESGRRPRRVRDREVEVGGDEVRKQRRLGRADEHHCPPADLVARLPCRREEMVGAQLGGRHTSVSATFDWSGHIQRAAPKRVTASAMPNSQYERMSSAENVTRSV